MYIVFPHTLLLTWHKVTFSHYYTAHLAVLGSSNAFFLPQFFFDMIYQATAVTLVRGSLLYSALIIHLCYDGGVCACQTDIYFRVETAISTASLAKRNGALHGLNEKKWRNKGASEDVPTEVEKDILEHGEGVGEGVAVVEEETGADRASHKIVRDAPEDTPAVVKP